MFKSERRKLKCSPSRIANSTSNSNDENRICAPSLHSIISLRLHIFSSTSLPLQIYSPPADLFSSTLQDQEHPKHMNEIHDVEDARRGDIKKPRCFSPKGPSRPPNPFSKGPRVEIRFRGQRHHRIHPRSRRSRDRGDRRELFKIWTMIDEHPCPHVRYDPIENETGTRNK